MAQKMEFKPSGLVIGRTGAYTRLGTGASTVSGPEPVLELTSSVSNFL